MKLIEKKCPNCGAGLEFNDTDKSCKCTYCNKSFEIERNSDNVDDYNLKIATNTSSFVLPIIIFSVFAMAIIVFVFFNIFAFNNKLNVSKDSITEEKTTNDYFVSVDEFSNSDFEALDNTSTAIVKRTGEGVNDAYHSYILDNNLKREKVYVAGKDNGNVIISIYKGIYKDFFHQENTYTVYIPILYENIKKTDFNKFQNPQLKAPEYYFNSEKTSYTYGYGSIDDIYNNIIKPLESDYKLSSK